VDEVDGVDLEVEVRDAPVRVTRVSDEPEHVPRLHALARHRERGVRAQMRVVELVAEGVAEPEAPAADVVPADREEGAVGDREHRRSRWRDEVLAVVPLAGDVPSVGAERVAEGGGPEEREHIAALAEPRRDLRR